MYARPVSSVKLITGLSGGPFGPYKLFHLTLRGGRKVWALLQGRHILRWRLAEIVLRALIIARERKPFTLQEVCLLSCFLYFPPFPCGLRITTAELLWHYIRPSHPLSRDVCVCVSIYCDSLWGDASWKQSFLRCLNIIIHLLVLSALNKSFHAHRLQHPTMNYAWVPIVLIGLNSN